MAKFNTHGGYFSPKGYLRVDTGGSHEENPNGGVQIGVDPEGTPNMLEEGEPVYNDYVYSDNITAEAEILMKYKIPTKFAGKLYSVIADSFVDEAEERPLDPTSNNGLNAMLVRLADAQEEQKQIQEQKELEEELAKLSPEELEELEAYLAQSEETPVEEEVPMEQMPVEQVPMQMPMMANGGFIRRFDLGGPTDDDRVAELMAQIAAEREAQEALMQEKLAKEQQAQQIKTAEAEVKRLTRAVKRNENAVARVERHLKNVNPHDMAAYKQTMLKTYDTVKYNKGRLEEAQKRLDSLMNLGAPAVQMPMATAPVGSTATAPVKSPVIAADQDDVTWAMGGKMNRFDGGGWADFFKSLGDYGVSLNPGGTTGTYQIDKQFVLPEGMSDIKALEDSDFYKRFTDYVIANPTNENVLKYLRMLDDRTNSNNGVAKLFDANGNLVNGWDKLYRSRRNDQRGGIYHFTPSSLASVNSIIQSGRATLPTVSPATKATMDFTLDKGIVQNDWMPDTKTLIRDPEREASLRGKAKELALNEGQSPLSTLPRYAGAITSGILGLYNAFQEPDKYELPHYNPVLPYGQMDLIDPVYNPLDQNMAIQSLLAQSSGTNRALQNSGLGPSVGANILAADYNAGRNMGNALTQVWDANNQRLNDVINRRNQNGIALGNFNYGQNRDRAQILNDAMYRNGRNDLMLQQLNYNAEAQKYAAIQQQLDQIGKALAGIGLENRRLNSINFDDAYDYITGLSGVSAYEGNSAKCGGKIKTKKK